MEDCQGILEEILEEAKRNGFILNDDVKNVLQELVNDPSCRKFFSKGFVYIDMIRLLLLQSFINSNDQKRAFILWLKNYFKNSSKKDLEESKDLKESIESNLLYYVTRGISQELSHSIMRRSSWDDNKSVHEIIQILCPDEVQVFDSLITDIMCELEDDNGIKPYLPDHFIIF